MSTINRDQLLASLSLQAEDVEIDGYEGTFTVKELPGTAITEVYEASSKANGSANTEFMRELVYRSVVDDGGSRIFDKADIDQFPMGLLRALFDAAQRVNNLGADTEGN